ncbi:uncharacterized protein LOC6048809 isoform X1 [Culex quinquefasciatus]|uniref:uncharacterized protein LOC6048809 isoform X1 n=1 Tax=Culex quinquefasciatus TaxID=7176 RepID=UPI0018E3A005|nr:uncharacterized protein LOC6048809 isoform X1 [Culex quinquefasciatus]XP_038119535.1 uncharacterized protein LOC6048809 isoform X1 [Culex quinquefasciatus]
MSTWRGNALSGLVHATPTSTNFVSWYRKSTQVDPACHLSEMVVGLGKVYEVPVVPDVTELNHALQAPLRQDSGGDACVVPALKCAAISAACANPAATYFAGLRRPGPGSPAVLIKVRGIWATDGLRCYVPRSSRRRC